MIFPNLFSLIKNDAKCVLAFSGGLDSTVLLHQLIKLKHEHIQLQIRALHVHHGLSSNSDNWAIHCQRICEKWEIPCKVLYIEVINIKTKGIEAAAREARYKVLFDDLRSNECLLTAQHLDDQCETLFLALKRGSGPAGLSSMPQQCWINGHLHLRPFLNYKRQQLVLYAIKHNLSWVKDESNLDSRYDRNFLRLQVLPLLKERWQHFTESVSRSAILCAQQEQLLDELLAKKLEELIDKDGSLYFPPLLKLSEVHRHALLRRWIATQKDSIMPSFMSLRRITCEIMCSRKDAQPRIRFTNFEIRRYRKKLYWLPLFISLQHQQLIWSDRNKPLLLPQNLGELRANSDINQLRQPKKNEQIIIRFAANGYYNFLERKGGGCKIKKLWQELAIPPWERERIPFIYYNEVLISAPKLFITREGVVLNDDSGWQVVWIK